VSAVIEVEGLRKEFRRLRGPATVAINGLDLSVPEGGVFGFLGPNGSGKTTTIRCLLGLVEPTAGTCHLLGHKTPKELPRVVGRVGSVVETPTFFPRMSGRRNLILLAGLARIPVTMVDQCLDFVGLGPRKNDPVRTYSLGMKQRLGLAAALLKDPKLLILDEPANGLDPAGIKEVRELLRNLGEQGKTVFVSSHILAEVAQTCDSVAILSRGRLVTSGSVEEILASGRPTGMLVRVGDQRAGAEALTRAGFEVEIRDDSLSVSAPPSEGQRITQVLADAGLYLSELRPEQIDLESVFLELTREQDA
jgi:ABC-2 type transport system ATP-binding protein